MKVNMQSAMPGCVFEHHGKIPETVYNPEEFHSPLEKAVYNNDMSLFKKLTKVLFCHIMGVFHSKTCLQGMLQ